MAHLKQRTSLHIMESDSISIFHEKIPREWVVREYKPDYGIDLAVEIFDKVKGKKGLYETLGEHFFVQLKSCQQLEYTTIKVNQRRNVELGPLSKFEDDPKEEIKTVKFALETNLLLTVQNMGPAEIVFLILVDLSNKKTFFICLNDYIDKVIIPNDPLYSNKESKTIYVPTSNEINRSNKNLLPIRFIAKRAKFYAAFEKFQYHYYQINKLDLNRSIGGFNLHDLLKTFINNIRRLDIWRGTDMWDILKKYKEDLETFDKLLELKKFNDSVLEEWAQKLWYGLSVLSWNYEEMCREWFLPTSLAVQCSTPNEITLSKNPTLPIRAGCVSYAYLKNRKKIRKNR